MDRNWSNTHWDHQNWSTGSGSFHHSSTSWSPYKKYGYNQEISKSLSLDDSLSKSSQSSLSSSDRDKHDDEHKVTKEPAFKTFTNRNNVYGRNFSRQTSQISQISSASSDTSHLNSRSTSTSESMFDDIDPLTLHDMKKRYYNNSGYQYSNFTGATRCRSLSENFVVSPYSFKNHDSDLTMNKNKQQKKRRDLIIQDEEEEDYPFAKHTFNKKVADKSYKNDDSTSSFSTSSQRSSSHDSIYSVGMMKQYTHLQTRGNRQLLNKSSSSLFSSMASSSVEPMGSIEDTGGPADSYVSDWKHKNSSLYSQNSTSSLYPKPFVNERPLAAPAAFPYGMYKYAPPAAPLSPVCPEQVLSSLGFGEAQSFLPERFLRSWIDKVVLSQEEEYMRRMMHPPPLPPVFHSDHYFADDNDLPPSVSAQQSGRSSPKWKQSFDSGPQFPSTFSPKSKIPPRRILKRAHTVDYNTQSMLSEENNSVTDTDYHIESSNTNFSGLPLQKENSFDKLKKILRSTDPIPRRDRDSRRNMFASSRQQSLPLFLETLSEEEEEKRRSRTPSFEKMATGKRTALKNSFIEEEERLSSKTSSIESQSDTSRRSSYSYNSAISDMLQSVKDSLSALESESDDTSENSSNKYHDSTQQMNIPSIVVSEKSTYNDLGKSEIVDLIDRRQIGEVRNKFSEFSWSSIPRPISPNPEAQNKPIMRPVSWNPDEERKSPQSFHSQSLSDKQTTLMTKPSSSYPDKDSAVRSSSPKRSHSPFRIVTSNPDRINENCPSLDSLEIADIMSPKCKKLTVGLSTTDSASNTECANAAVTPKPRRRHSTSSKFLGITLDVEDKFLSPSPSLASPNIMSPITVIEIGKLDNQNDSLEMEEVKGHDSSSENTSSEKQKIKKKSKQIARAKIKNSANINGSPKQLSTVPSLDDTPRSLSLERRSYELDRDVSDDNENVEGTWLIDKKDCTDMEVQAEFQPLGPLIRFSEISSMLEVMLSRLPKCSLENILYLAQDKYVQCDLLTDNSLAGKEVCCSQGKLSKVETEIPVEKRKNVFAKYLKEDISETNADTEMRSDEDCRNDTQFCSKVTVVKSNENGQNNENEETLIVSQDKSCQTEDVKDEMKEAFTERYNEFVEQLQKTRYYQHADSVNQQITVAAEKCEGNNALAQLPNPLIQANIKQHEPLDTVTHKIHGASNRQAEVSDTDTDDIEIIDKCTNNSITKVEASKKESFDIQSTTYAIQTEESNSCSSKQTTGTIKEPTIKHHIPELRVTSKKEIQLGKNSQIERNQKIFRSEAFFVLRQKSLDDTEMDLMKYSGPSALTSVIIVNRGCSERIEKILEQPCDVKPTLETFTKTKPTVCGGNETKQYLQSLDIIKPLQQDMNETKITLQNISETKSTLQTVNDLKPTLQDVNEIEQTLQNLNETKLTMQNVTEINPTLKSVNDLIPTLQHVNEIKPTFQIVIETKPTLQNVNDLKRTLQHVNEIKSTLQNMNDFKPTLQNVNETEPTLQEVKEIKSTLQNVNDLRPTIQHVNEIKPTFQNVSETQPTLQNVNDLKPTLQHVNEIKPILQNVNETKSTLQNVNDLKLTLQNVNEVEATMQILSMQNVNETKSVLQNVNETKPALQTVIKAKPALQNEESFNNLNKNLDIKHTRDMDSDENPSTQVQLDRLNVHRSDYEPCDDYDVRKLGVFCDGSPEIMQTSAQKANDNENNMEFLFDNSEARWKYLNIYYPTSELVHENTVETDPSTEFSELRAINTVNLDAENNSNLPDVILKDNVGQTATLCKCHSEIKFNFDRSRIGEPTKCVPTSGDQENKSNHEVGAFSLKRDMISSKSISNNACITKVNLLPSDETQNNDINVDTMQKPNINCDVVEHKLEENSDSNNFPMQIKHTDEEEFRNTDSFVTEQQYECKDIDKNADVQDAKSRDSNKIHDQDLFVRVDHLNFGSAEEKNQENNLRHDKEVVTSSVRSIIYPTTGLSPQLSRREYSDNKNNESSTIQSNHLENKDKSMSPVQTNSIFPNLFSSNYKNQFIAEVSSPTDSDSNNANENKKFKSQKLKQSNNLESESSDSSTTLFNSAKEILLSFNSSDRSRTLSLRSSYEYDQEKETIDHDLKVVNGTARQLNDQQMYKGTCQSSNVSDQERFKSLYKISCSENVSNVGSLHVERSGEADNSKLSRSLDFDTISLRKNILKQCQNTAFSKTLDTGTDLFMDGDIVEFDEADINEGCDASWENNFDWSADYLSKNKVSSVIKTAFDTVLETNKHWARQVNENSTVMVEDENDSEDHINENYSEDFENEGDKVQYQIGVKYNSDNEFVDVYGRVKVIKNDPHSESIDRDNSEGHYPGMSKFAHAEKGNISENGHVVHIDTGNRKSMFDIFQQVDEDDSGHHAEETRTALEEIEQLYKMSVDDEFLYGKENTTASALKNFELDDYGNQANAQVGYGEFMEELEIEIKQMETYTLKNCEKHLCRNCGHSVTLTSKVYSPEPIEHDFCIECSPLNLTTEMLEKRRLQKMK